MNPATVNVCLIGQKFMGRAHSNAYLKADKFFSLPLKPVMHTVCGRDANELATFANRWGWQKTSVDWRSAVRDPEIELVDVSTPNDVHLEMTLAALEAGKHVACEKPLAGTLDEARQMRDAAREARGKTFVWWSYRRTPAVTLMRDLVRSGKIGRIYHVRGYYLQDWAGPDVPLIWRFNKDIAGSGSHGDLGAHIIDMTRFVTGEEFTEIDGAIMETFIKQREIPRQGSSGGLAGGSSGAKGTMGDVNIDDATLFLCRFSGGAVGNFEATRLATGYQNKNGIEVHGEKGAVSFDFERMNELRFIDNTVDAKVRGWTRIMVTHAPDHPYAEAWWPDAHIIGYEHTFINQVADMMKVLGGKQPAAPIGDFEDAYQTQRVLESVVISATERRPVKLDEVQ
ncbi:MAG: Gfo/Idh/MocA family oxidoreductase [Phycisphaerae bacterium]|nr:Gfo/Idh/MocA family oxidoreductase [Phycisphaerae bacterium]